MKRDTVLRAFLIVTILIATLYGLYEYWPESYASTDLPQKEYELYDIFPRKDNEECEIKFVTVIYDGEVKRIISRSNSPVKALIDSGYSVSNRNRVISTSPISQLQNNSFIQVETYNATIDEVLLEIPYETVLKGEVLCKSLSQEVKEQTGVLGIVTQRIKRTYRGEELISEEIIEENIQREARPEIIAIRGPQDLPNSVTQRGADCNHWNTYIDSSINATQEEKQWLKFVMKWESGCNAESNKSYFKGLFQWNPCLWYKQFPSDNIFDGEAQIKRTLQKLREGANPNQMWPAVHKKYKQNYPELSWL